MNGIIAHPYSKKSKLVAASSEEVPVKALTLKAATIPIQIAAGKRYLTKSTM